MYCVWITVIVQYCTAASRLRAYSTVHGFAILAVQYCTAIRVVWLYSSALMVPLPVGFSQVQANG
jgi:hypothetical protein